MNTGTIRKNTTEHDMNAATHTHLDIFSAIGSGQHLDDFGFYSNGDLYRVEAVNFDLKLNGPVFTGRLDDGEKTAKIQCPISMVEFILIP